VAVRLVDEQGREVAPGTPGEIEVRGPSVFREYWRRQRRLKSLLASSGTARKEHGSGLGQTRSLVEPTLRGVGHCRRLKPGSERFGEPFQAVPELAAGLSCPNRLEDLDLANSGF
jgi:acyl-CoA synthetase (AMP-forming)/AMP-acid ligase II